ncbi:hypothetical protein EVAR_45363_1 [Eumeta japonica]|uniref:Uncharacterized protein n=1 Tax=Eumeta variegata TaxID=151549 RepID=A0A4C1Y0Z2_EUMVA|nr:hypothetical protein EVAR_45363_1 [Eumeta japonica]
MGKMYYACWNAIRYSYGPPTIDGSRSEAQDSGARYGTESVSKISIAIPTGLVLFIVSNPVVVGQLRTRAPASHARATAPLAAGGTAILGSGRSRLRAPSFFVFRFQ